MILRFTRILLITAMFAFVVCLAAADEVTITINGTVSYASNPGVTGLVAGSHYTAIITYDSNATPFDVSSYYGGTKADYFTGTYQFVGGNVNATDTNPHWVISHDYANGSYSHEDSIGIDSGFDGLPSNLGFVAYIGGLISNTALPSDPSVFTEHFPADNTSYQSFYLVNTSSTFLRLGIDSITATSTPLPASTAEPGSLLLLASGVLSGIGFWRRKWIV